MQEKDKIGQDVPQGGHSNEQPQNALGREMEGEGMSSNYSGMGNLTTGSNDTGETATMTTPGSSKTGDQASQGHRIAGEDNRQ